MTFTILLVLLLIAGIYLFMQQPPFGQLSSGERLNRIQNSPNYKNGKFQNISHTPDLAEGVTYWAVIKEFFFTKHPRKIPSTQLPSKKIDLHHLHPDENMLVWFGHSSYFMKVDGKTFLVDPVMSGGASPIRFTTRSFNGTDVYTPDDLPEIDFLFLSHDHWDHLDYKTIVKLKSKIKFIITGLGVGAHLERWGFSPTIIHEKDWHETFDIAPGFTVNTLSARHFSGRGFKRNNSLWMSFAVKTLSLNIYIGGDSGYDKHFNEIGNKFGPFDLAILENGQYDKSWKYIHMMPEEVVRAGVELKASVVMPVHWSKFSLSNHTWDDPILRITNEAALKNLQLIHPLIGEKVDLRNTSASTMKWWEGME